MVRVLSFAHLWIAGAAAVTTWASWTWLGMGKGSEIWALWIGLSTGLGYTIQRAIKHGFDSSSLPPLRRSFWDTWRHAMLGGWASAWMAFTAWNWSDLGLLDRWPLLVTLAALGLLYAVVPGKRQGFRASPWLKIPLIATAWALATTPVLEDLHPQLFASRWLLIAGLTLPFDIRDLAVDQNRITTVPMALGGTLSLRIAAWMLLGSGLCFCASEAWTSQPALSAIFLAQSVLASAIVASSALSRALHEGSELQRERWTGLVLDGTLWLPLAHAVYVLL